MWSRRQGGPRVKNASKLYVQPSEVAGKLVKEMEEDKVARGTHVSVRNRYTVYLCREDYERWRRQEEQLVAKLEMHLNRHMRSKGYEAPGAIDVKLLPDPDLRLGNYGIHAEREMPSGVVRKGRAGSSPASAGAAGRAAAEPPAQRVREPPWPVACPVVLGVRASVRLEWRRPVPRPNGRQRVVTSEPFRPGRRVSSRSRLTPAPRPMRLLPAACRSVPSAL